MLKIQVPGDKHEVNPYLQQSTNRVLTIHLYTQTGVHLYLPLFDLIQCEIEPGKHIITGKFFQSRWKEAED